MRTRLLAIVGVLAALLAGPACGGGGGPSEYKHPGPKFKVSYPDGLTVRKVKQDQDAFNLSISSDDYSRDLFLLWAPTGSTYDPAGPWSRYGKEPDHVKTLEEGALPGGGKFIINDRGARVFVHAMITTDGHGVLCMTSARTATEPADKALLDACKTLSAY